MSNKKKIKLEVNKSLLLDNPNKFLLITDGKVDVYFTHVDNNNNYISNLQYLYTAKKGELLFSLFTESIQTGLKLVVVSAGAKLLHIDKNELLDFDHTYLKSMIEIWSIKTIKAIHKTNPPRVYKSTENIKSISLQKDDIIYPYKGIAWCKVKKGKVLKYTDVNTQDEILETNFPFIVSSYYWAKSLENNTELEIQNTREFLQDDKNFILSFNEFQNDLYNRLVKKDENQRFAQKKQITDKVASEKENLSISLDRFRSVVMDKKDLDTISATKTGVTNNLLKTCQLIGDKVGFEFEAPKFMESYNSSTTNQLFAIAQTSKVRVRKIILRGTWWKEENGHLLAFYKEDKRPVALIQRTPTTYLIKDVKTGEEKIVTNDIAGKLEPICYMFFYGFDGVMNSIRKIFSFAIQGVKKDSKFLILAALAGSLIGLLVPILSGIMFDDIIPTADKSFLYQIIVIMLIIGILTAGLQLIQGVLQLRIETKSNVNLQAGVMDHLLRLPVSFYKEYSTGDLTNRVLSINAIRQIISNTVLTAVLSGAFSIVNLALLFYYQSSLAWAGIGLALIAMLFIAGIGLLKLKYDRQISEKQGKLQGFLFEFLSGITKIRITGAEKRIFSLWANKFSKLKQLGFKSGSYQNYVETFNSSYPLFTSIIFFSYIYYIFKTGNAETKMITVGAFMAFISAFNKFLRDSLKMSMAVITSLNVVTLYERVKPILESTPESTEDSVDPGELAGEIEMNGVSFRYNEDQPLVLKDISFKIKAGEMVAFVGTSGSGKSTIMRILLGFENPEIGSVYYDGDAFDSMNKDMVRRQIGVVLQNGALMSGSIFKNIVGNSELTLDDAWEAARMAGMEDDIKQMPMELHTMISEGAGTFSGGQRQRLMIARAIVHKPRLLFMDEATSALDNKTQNVVSDSLDKLQATRIVIAHRLSTIINADRIYVMDKGMIIESGNYEELMEKEGLFYTLAKRQIV